MTRLKRGLFNLLNDEFDLAEDGFEELWPEFLELLKEHGMETS